jgi:integrase/recombinase XerD
MTWPCPADRRGEYADYLRALGRAPGTIRYMVYYLDLFFSYLTRRSIDDPAAVTPPVIEDYHREVYQARRFRGGGKISPMTIFHRLWSVKSYFQFLTDKGHIMLDPTAHFDLPPVRGAPPKLVLNEYEIRAVIEKPDVQTPTGIRDRAIMELFYSTGIRRQELLNLNVTDLDLGRGMVRVNHGKGGKDRVVPVGETACRFLELYIRTVRDKSLNVLLRGKTFTVAEPALFLSQFGGRLDTGALHWILRRYVREAFPGRQFSCHGFRHACATHMLRGGADIRLVQEMLGHKHLETTQVYTHLVPMDLKEAHRRHHPRGKIDKRKNDR